MEFPLLFLALGFFARAENIVFPPESSIVDVKSAYGAKGDGTTDDTDALKTKTGTVIIERFFLLGGWEGPKSETFFGNSGANTVIVQSIGMSGSIKAATGPAADWFVDDVSPGRQATLPGWNMGLYRSGK